jgi:hypothetical protein
MYFYTTQTWKINTMKDEYSITFLVKITEEKVIITEIASQNFYARYEEFKELCEFVENQATAHFNQVKSRSKKDDRIELSKNGYHITIIFSEMENSGDEPIEKAAKCGNIQDVKLFLKDEKTDPFFAMWDACRNNHENIVELLLLDPRVDLDLQHIIMAVQGSHCNLGMKLLRKLGIGRFMCYSCKDHNILLQSAGQKGCLAMVDFLLQYDIVDPSYEHNETLRRAHISGQHVFVNRLLRNKRVLDTWAEDALLLEENALKFENDPLSNPLYVVQRHYTKLSESLGCQPGHFGPVSKLAKIEYVSF